MTNPSHSNHPTVNRRQLLQTAAGAAALGVAMKGTSAMAEGELPGKVVKNGRINQSIVQWCFQKYWEIEQTAELAAKMGVKSVELVDPKHWPMLKKHGLVCAIASSHGFKTGMNDPKNWDMCIEKMRTLIDACAEHKFPSVITFTGYGTPEITPDIGMKNCVEGYKKIIGYAEKKKVTLCLEMLNTRDDTHPMKGHPGYQGDDTEYCIEIIKKVGSDNLKLLFDIYHVQIMNGDVIRRIHQHKDYLGHIHTAGNPGRAELDNKQEINYPATMQALLDVGYKGYVGQEFIPTRDPLKGLTEAVALCDV